MKYFFKYFVCGLVLPLAFFIAFLMWFMPSPAEGELPIRIINKDWGTVTSIDNCRKYKYSLHCKVNTTTVRFDEIDITDFPKDNLKVGDKISLKIEMFEKSYHTYYVKNGWQIPISGCYWLMPCFDNYDEES